LLVEHWLSDLIRPPVNDPPIARPSSGWLGICRSECSWSSKHGDYHRCVAQKAAARNGIFSAGDRGTEREKRLEKIARNGQKRGLLVRWL
jgi:hypothetical protein